MFLAELMSTFPAQQFILSISMTLTTTNADVFSFSFFKKITDTLHFSELYVLGNVFVAFDCRP